MTPFLRLRATLLSHVTRPAERWRPARRGRVGSRSLRAFSTKLVPVTQAELRGKREGQHIKGMQNGTDVCHASFKFFFFLLFFFSLPLSFFTGLNFSSASPSKAPAERPINYITHRDASQQLMTSFFSQSWLLSCVPLGQLYHAKLI